MRFNKKAIFGTLGILIFFLGIALVVPFIASLILKDGQWTAFLWTILICTISGGLLHFLYRTSQPELRIREGFAVVSLSWLVLSLLGCLPYIFGDPMLSYTDAFFETMSGFTTTGATILGGTQIIQIEEMPPSLLFWRSCTQWLGGMGIIVLTIAILPMMGTGGMKLFQAEVPGPSTDKLTPRISETAKRLWLIYLGLTLTQLAFLWPVVGGFDAINHALTTMASGGFSTLNESVGQFGSVYVEWVVIVFMILSGINFGLYYRILLKDFFKLKKDEELRLYLVVLVGASALIFFSVYEPLSLGAQGTSKLSYSSIHDAIRNAVFQTVSIVTSTGYTTQDYELWPALGLGVIFLLFFVGGMAGSTAGGVKIIRHVLLYKNTYREIKQLIHPNAIFPLRYNGKVVDRDVIRNVLSFIVLYIALMAGGVLLLSLMGIDLMTSLGAAMSAVGNVGPAFGSIGPSESFAHLPALAKWLLSFLMLAGRLEIFTVLVLLMPAYWRK